jgi:hypothetical protein
MVALPSLAQAVQGTVTTTYNVVAPTKPTAALANRGVGLVSTGTHTYKTTILDAGGETLPSTASASITTDETTNGKVLVTIPAFVTGQTGANVYRQVAGSTGAWKLVNATPISVAGDYEDNIADGSLGADAPSSNTTTTPLADPTDSPVVALANEGAGNCSIGDHLVKVAYTTSAGVSTLSPASDTVTIADNTVNGQIAVTIVASANASVTGVNVYITAAGGSDYFLSATGPNTNGTIYANTADTSLTSAAPTTDTSGDDTIIGTDTSKSYMFWVRNNDVSLPVYLSFNGEQVNTTSGPFIAAGKDLLMPFPVQLPGGGAIRLRSTTAGVSVTYVLWPK